MLKYVALGELRSLTNPEGNDEAAVLVRMVETYDPERQAVVMASIDGENPISIKIRLERPNLVDEASGTH